MQNVILVIPNTLLIWDGNEPLTPTSISRVPTSCLSKVSTGKSQSSRLLETIHFIDYSACLSSPPTLLTIWEDPKTHLSPHCPPRRFPPTLTLLDLQVLSQTPKAALVWRMMKENPAAPPGPLSTEMEGIARADLDQGLGLLLLCGLEGLWFASHL